MSREKYCKFCGRELDGGKCSCNAFLLSQNKEKKSKKEKVYIVCDTCKAKVENDANYCPNCGLPIHANGKIDALQKELEGIGAPDVIEVYSIKENNKKQKNNYGIALVATIALTTFVFGIAIGLVIKPKIDAFIRNITIKNSIALDENMNENTNVNTNASIDEPTTINGPTVHEEILSPTAGEKKEKQDRDSSSESQENDDEKETYSDEQEDDETETAETNANNEATNDKKNLIDKTSKIETVTIKQEDGGTTTEKVSAANLEVTGVIKGVSDEDKKKVDIYIERLRSIKDTVSKDGKTCEISFYAPVLAGKDEEEIKIANAAYTFAFDQDFLTKLKNRANSYSELPQSIIFTEVDQRNLTSRRLFIVVSGKVTPQSGFTQTIKYRALYDRKEHTVKLELIADQNTD